MRHLVRFLTQDRVGRTITSFVHPRIHPGIRPLQFGAGCWLCNAVTAEVFKQLPPEAFTDRSSILVREGTDTHRTIRMSATAQRQLERIVAEHPDVADRLWATLDQIADKERTDGPSSDS